MKNARIFALLLAGLFLGHNLAWAQKVPQTIPSFTFYALKSDKIFSNENLPQTGYLIFNLYDPGCGHCQRLGAGIAKNKDKFKQATIYFIAMNDAEFIEDFIEKYTQSLKSNKNFVFLRDKEVDFIPKFHPKQFPAVYVFDAKTKTLIRHFDGQEDVKKILAVLK